MNFIHHRKCVLQNSDFPGCVGSAEVVPNSIAGSRFLSTPFNNLATDKCKTASSLHKSPCNTQQRHEQLRTPQEVLVFVSYNTKQVSHFAAFCNLHRAFWCWTFMNVPFLLSEAVYHLV